MKEEYLGDAVYASFDGYYIILTVSNGVRVTDRIYLEPAVMDNLTDYNEYIRRGPRDAIDSVVTSEP